MYLISISYKPEAYSDLSMAHYLTHHLVCHLKRPWFDKNLNFQVFDIWKKYRPTQDNNAADTVMIRMLQQTKPSSSRQLRNRVQKYLIKFYIHFKISWLWHFLICWYRVSREEEISDINRHSIFQGQSHILPIGLASWAKAKTRHCLFCISPSKVTQINDTCYF